MRTSLCHHFPNLKTSISLKRRKAFQKWKHHSSYLWKNFQISSRYFSFHRHFNHIYGIHGNRSKPFTKTKVYREVLQDLNYCKHKGVSPKLDIILLLTNWPQCFDSSFGNLIFYQDNILSWWCSNMLPLWGEIICSPLLGLPQSTFLKTSPTCLPWKNGFHIIAEPEKIHNQIQI